MGYRIITGQFQNYRCHIWKQNDKCTAQKITLPKTKTITVYSHHTHLDERKAEDNTKKK